MIGRSNDRHESVTMRLYRYLIVRQCSVAFECVTEHIESRVDGDISRKGHHIQRINDGEKGFETTETARVTNHLLYWLNSHIICYSISNRNDTVIYKFLSPNGRLAVVLGHVHDRYSWNDCSTTVSISYRLPVVSDPVPAVVGMAMRGSIGRSGILARPDRDTVGNRFVIDNWPKGGTMKSRKSACGLEV